MRRVTLWAALCVCALTPPLSSCRGRRAAPRLTSASGSAQAQAAPARSPTPIASASPSPATDPDRALVLLAGGDVDLSRRTGQRILREPSLDPLRAMQPLFATADVRFANLESQLCELNGVTGSPGNPLVFAGPPGGAAVLARSRFDVMSTANNHAWDYGKPCLVETMDRLHAAGIQPVGTDARGEDPMRPVVVQRGGRKLALFAVTAIFNDGPLPKHEASAYVAYADIGALARRIAAIRASVDWVVVSVHIGEEYLVVPIEATRYVLIATADAGADVVIGHHTHTLQRVEFHDGKPIVFSLGNLVFHENSSHPWTGWSALARVRFADGRPPALELCPYHLFDAAASPLDDQLRPAFVSHLDAISKHPAAARRGPLSADGCIAMLPP